MSFSRSNPSPRYHHLIKQYQTMHVEGEKSLGITPQNTFSGQSLIPQADSIRTLIIRYGAESILDYGCGKGFQYGPMNIKNADGRVLGSIKEYWGVKQISCYDPSYVPHSNLPSGKFDGVISTDVLEHCPEEDMDWILDEIFRYATKFVFANVACFPAKKHLPSGENAHITIYPALWWEEKIRSTAKRNPGPAWEFWIQQRKDTPEGPSYFEERISS